MVRLFGRHLNALQASLLAQCLKKKSAYNAGDPGLIPRLGRSPGEGNLQRTPVFLPGKSQGQRSLEGYNPWGCKESSTTQWLNQTM